MRGKVILPAFLPFLAAFTGSSADSRWQLALPGWTYEFPRDHGNHPDFKTEWWYFTGNLRSESGREFGYQLTFFRQGVIPPAHPLAATSRFVTRNIQFVHFTISDFSNSKFHFGQSLSRGAFGEAGFSDGARLAWIDDCSLALQPDGAFRLIGRDAGKSIDLVLRPAKRVVIHGENGVSRKADGEGRASHYYSLTRLATSGRLKLGKESFEVQGLSWFDHEWATNQLARNQIGWDWFSLQFEDGSELMLFQLRTKDGGRDRWSGGSWITAAGETTRIADADFKLESSAVWKSVETGGAYPTCWRIRVPKLQLEVEVSARMQDQELRLTPIAYWEGAVSAKGRRGDVEMRGKGYLEMTGYAGEIVGLREGEAPAEP